MTFKPGYTRHKRVYSFRAWVDEKGWNKDRYHRDGPHANCDCLKLWDLNRTGLGHNIIRITRGKGHFVILLGRKYHKIAIRQRKKAYA
jgi:hypothetical protein